jgi:hypothetical protein
MHVLLDTRISHLDNAAEGSPGPNAGAVRTRMFGVNDTCGATTWILHWVQPCSGQGTPIQAVVSQWLTYPASQRQVVHGQSYDITWGGTYVSYVDVHLE